MKSLPTIECSEKNAHAWTEGNRLIVTTGRLRRVWCWTAEGFATCEVIDDDAGRSWTGQVAGCDWQPPDGLAAAAGHLEALSAVVNDDEGFTGKHVAVRARIAYRDLGFLAQWSVWAYPGAPGLRTHLSLRRIDGATTPEPPSGQGQPADTRVDRVPIGAGPCRRRLLGYYNDTQHRNDTYLDLLKEHVIAHPLRGREWCDWASAACVEDDAGGIALVKESHKCVNQPGHATGGFVCDETDGLSCTGWGLHVDEVSADAFTPAWATWCLVWSGGDLQREIAFKSFDAVRYPIDPRRDIHVQANTWGSTDNGRDARRAACQGSVLAEIDACADLGVDILQIDDGWQVPPGHPHWDPGANGWRPHPEAHPGGWAPVRARAAERGVKLGLWAPAMSISGDDLKASHTEGGFVQYKLDFARLAGRAEIEALMRKVRDFIAWTGHRVRVNWDVTENAARYGYFFAREYGPIYLENRKPVRPPSVVYRPHTVLRDLWQAAKYLNLHRFQCTIQNVDRVDRQRSDAHLHSHGYATAIALMGVPLLFQELKYLSKQARDDIRRLLGVYKAHREAIYRGIVHPLGAKPDNARWSGFQCHLDDDTGGYLLIFRERCNTEATGTLDLGWVRPGTLALTDLLTGRRRQAPVGRDGAVTFRIDRAPGFGFLRYDAQPPATS